MIRLVSQFIIGQREPAVLVGGSTHFQEHLGFDGLRVINSFHSEAEETIEIALESGEVC